MNLFNVNQPNPLKFVFSWLVLTFIGIMSISFAIVSLPGCTPEQAQSFSDEIDREIGRIDAQIDAVQVAIEEKVSSVNSRVDWAQGLLGAITGAFGIGGLGIAGKKAIEKLAKGVQQ